MVAKFSNDNLTQILSMTSNIHIIFWMCRCGTTFSGMIDEAMLFICIHSRNSSTAWDTTFSVFRKPKPISTLFPDKLDDDLSLKNQRTQIMEINILRYPDEPTTDFTSLPSDHSRPSIACILSELPTACEIPRVTSIHSSKNVRVRHNKSRSK